MNAQAATLRAGIYGRESKDKLKSIDDQTEDGRAACDERAWTIAGEYADGVSASRFGGKVRKDWRRLLADLDAGLLDVVVAWEPSRADRDLETWVQFVSRCRTRGVLVHLTGDDDTLDPRNPSHWHRLITGGLDAAMESEKISKRVRRGTGKAAVAGEPHGRPPYGYIRVIVGERATPKGPKPVKEQRPSETAPIVREIFARIKRLDPILAIERDLNARGVPAPYGGRWNRDTIRHIARNVAYIGERRHRTSREGAEPTDERYEGTWEALVSADVFYAVQKVLDRPDRKKTKPGRARWLMSYVAHAPCGADIHVQPAREGRVDRYSCIGDGCATLAVAAGDEVLTRIIVGRLAQPDVRDMFTPDDDAAVQAARDEAARLQANLDGHYDKAAAGLLSAGGLAAMEQRLLPLIADAKSRARPVGVPPVMAELLDAGESGVAEVRRVWDGLSVAARREVVSLLAEVVISRATRRMTRWAAEGERLEVAMQQLGRSRWVGDERTWAEIWGFGNE